MCKSAQQAEVIESRLGSKEDAEQLKKWIRTQLPLETSQAEDAGAYHAMDKNRLTALPLMLSFTISLFEHGKLTEEDMPRTAQLGNKLRLLVKN